MFSWKQPQTRPIIVAHRGASAVAPENTLAAFSRAIDAGADAIELDVRLTRDGEIVVFHDSHLQRTTNGRGKVEEHSLADLRRLSAGAWFHRSFSSEMIPTLEEVLELLRGRTGLNIEIKTIPLRRNRIGIVERCSSMIQQYHAESYVLVSSFHHQHVNLTKRILPVVMTGILIHPLKHIGRSAFQAAHKEKADFIILGGGALRKNVVGKAHERRLEVGEFTVNTRRRFERALRYNVDAIFTDDPGRMIRLRSEMK